MVTIGLIYFICQALASNRGRKNPLWGGIGLIFYFPIAFFIVENLFPEDSLNDLLLGEGLSIILACLSSYLVISVTPKVDARKSKKETNWNFEVVGIFLVILSIFLFVTGIIINVNARKYGGSSVNVIYLVAFGVYSASKYMFQLQRQKQSYKYDKFLKVHNLNTVLFLRSFQNASIRVPKKKSWSLGQYLAWHEDHYYKKEGVTFEEILAKEIKKKIGPFIALGDPDDFLPSLGATKIYYGDNEWKQKIQEYFSLSKYILILEGVTEGLIWELEFIKNNINPQKIIILTYPNEYRKLIDDSWINMNNILNEIGYNLPVNDPGCGIMIEFDENWIPSISEYTNPIKLIRYLNEKSRINTIYNNEKELLNPIGNAINDLYKDQDKESINDNYINKK